MNIDIGFQPSCSEAVFRFYTIKPDQIHDILQAIATEVNTAQGVEGSEWREGAQKDRDAWVKETIIYNLMSNKEVAKFLEDKNVKDLKMSDFDQFIVKMNKDSQEYRRSKLARILKLRTCDIVLGTVPEYKKAKDYEKINILNCAGLGSNDSVVKIEKKAFTLNIGNNDISENKTGWVEVVKDMGIKVEEAEYSQSLKDIARDCTCGIVYFDGYSGLIKDEEKNDE